MCDELTEGDLDRAGMPVSRRGFAGIAAAGVAAGGAALALPFAARASAPSAVPGRAVTIPTADGTCDGWFAHPADGPRAAVIIWPDIRGLRPAFQAMAERLAGDGYAALVVNPFYRDAAGTVVRPDDDWTQPAIRERLFGYAAKLTRSAVGQDTGHFIDWLDAQPGVDSNRRVGLTGYCLGGPLTIFGAAVLPTRVGACASFHGSRQTNDTLDSPHLAIPATDAGYLFALGENDDSRDPQEKVRLSSVLSARDRWGEVEVYRGAMHGWTVPDGRAYHHDQAERAWARMLALFQATL